jgi:transcriptional regulator with XRE-family HTH domain
MKGKEPRFDGARLRAVRKQRGLSVHEVGQMARVTARHIWRLEANKRPHVAAVTLARIALALGVGMEYLVGLSDSPQPGRKEPRR